MITKLDSFPLSRIEDCVVQVKAVRFVTKLDLFKGYWQVLLTEWGHDVSAFITPAVFFFLLWVSVWETVSVAELDGVTFYLDDIVVVNESWEQHLKRLHLLLAHLEQTHLMANQCEFTGVNVTYLGKDKCAPSMLKWRRLTSMLSLPLKMN